MTRRPPGFTYANLMATLAVFITLGGGAYALSKDSVGSREIENGSVRSQELKDDDVRSADIEGNAVQGSAVADNSLTGADVFEAGLTAGGDLTGTLANAELADGAVDADALDVPFARLEIPRDASNCTAQLSVGSAAVVDIPWAIASEGGGVAPIPACATDFIAPVGGFYLTTVTITWSATGGATNFTLAIERGSNVIGEETIPVAVGGQDQTLAMATSVAEGAPIRASVSHDGGAGATVSGGEMVVHSSVRASDRLTPAAGRWRTGPAASAAPDSRRSWWRSSLRGRKIGPSGALARLSVRRSEKRIGPPLCREPPRNQGVLVLKDMQTENVQAKREAAQRWANHVTADQRVEDLWRYLLVSVLFPSPGRATEGRAQRNLSAFSRAQSSKGRGSRPSTSATVE